MAPGALTGFAGSWARVPGKSHIPRRQSPPAAADAFDPWTTLGISPEATEREAKQAYKRMVARCHPDVDPSPEAVERLQSVVRAYSVLTGEDRKIDEATLLRNAVENLNNEMEIKRQRIEQLKAQALSEEQEKKAMEEQLQVAMTKHTEVTVELGAMGGAALGLACFGPMGVVVGAMAGLAMREHEGAAGQAIRGVGTVAKGVLEAVGSVVEKPMGNAVKAVARP